LARPGRMAGMFLGIEKSILLMIRSTHGLKNTAAWLTQKRVTEDATQAV